MNLTSKSGFCVCGCGEPAVYAATHVSRKLRLRLTEADYVVDDRGYTTPCWIFKNQRGPRKTGHYNLVRIGRRQLLAHRVMYEQEVGPIPKGLVLDHLCRQTFCINPSHLEPVTYAENTRRSISTKLTWVDAEAIRASSLSARQLAVKYSVSPELIYQIRKGKIWKSG